MNAFDDASEVSARSMEILIPLLRLRSHDGRFVLTDKGRLSKSLQETIGDALINRANGDVVAVEMKAEEGNDYDNLFLEEWSNRSRFNRGWLDKLDTDVLLYHFLREDLLYVIDFQKLRAWAFLADSQRGTRNPGRLYDFQSKKQCRREQMNDTWGRCVPIDVIRAEVGYKLLRPQQELARAVKA